MLHACLQAAGRPLFQVSDEVNYLATIQHTIAQLHPPDEILSCASPPDGSLLPVLPGGGKVLFHYGGALLLWAACALDGSHAFLWLRLVNAMSLGVVVWATYRLAFLLSERNGACAAAAAALVACHPVLASFHGGVTPDGWANACSAVALLALGRILYGDHRIVVIIAGAGAVLVGALLKDTVLFLVPAAALTGGAWVWLAARRSVVGGVGAAAGCLLLGVGLIGASAWLRSPYMDRVTATAPTAWEPAVATAGMLASLALAGMPQLFRTAWDALGNFGGSELTLSRCWLIVVTMVHAAGIVGLLTLFVKAPRTSRVRAAASVYVLLLLACSLQPPLRQLLLGTSDTFQGRWLFPMAAGVSSLLVLGLQTLGLAHGRRLALWMLGNLALAATAWLQIMQYYFEQSGRPAWNVIFLLGMGGAEVDTARLRHWVITAQATSLVPLLMFAWIVAALLLIRPLLMPRLLGPRSTAS